MKILRMAVAPFEIRTEFLQNTSRRCPLGEDYDNGGGGDDNKEERVIVQRTAPVSSVI
jgi:hypothetical protein